MTSAQSCRHHPQRPVAALCQKYGHGLCADCLENHPHCPDPDIFCRHRPQCIIHHQYKEALRSNRTNDQAQGSQP
ncbi:MAG: hypothetical protein LDL07_06740 [Desulfarculus sp.]|nr:hypothetical protein [Desulfarculus sp.]